MLRIALNLLVVVGLVGCLDGTGDSAGDIPTDPRLNTMVEAHNLVRANVQPAASPPLPEMRWSSVLEEHALEHASKCVWEHSDQLQALEEGENLAAYSQVDVSTSQDVVTAWASEVAQYDYDTNGCTGVCGHYTQVVWRDSVEVGCAIVNCPNGLGGADPFPQGREIWDCRYSPPGNWVGEKPY